jgi:hypothetical protein
MAEMTIQLRIDPATGKKDVIIALRGDDDSLPHEHEQRHRALVDKLIEGGLLSAQELGKVIVEREAEQGEPASPVSAPSQEERRSLGAGN